MLDEQDKKAIQTMIDDGLAGAGERFAEQAKGAATETIEDLKGKVLSFEKAVEEMKATQDAAAKAAAGGAEKKAADEAAAKAATDKKAADDAAAKAAAERKAKRDAYLKEKAAKLPSAYLAGLGDTDDPAEMDRAISAGFAALKADADKGLIKLADAGASAGDAKGGSETPAISLAELDRDPRKKAQFIAEHGVEAFVKLAAKK